MATTKNGNDTPTPEQLTSEYFDSIKDNQAALRQFFSMMPKGGDVHNHLTGSAYAETYFELAAKKKMYVNLETGKLYKEEPKDIETIQLSKDMDDLHNHRMALIDKWSIRNFQPYKYPLGPDEYFFGTFGLLSALTVDTDDLAYLMHELKVRAVKENVQYLEVIGTSPSVPKYCFLSMEDYNHYDTLLKTCVKENSYGNIQSILSEIILKIDKESDSSVNDYSDSIYAIENKSNAFNDPENCDTKNVTCCYQGYASRGGEPLKVFAQLYVVHKLGERQRINTRYHKDSILMGCNLVAAENGEKSMLYYRLHMEMFAALAAEFPNVLTSLHAGELTLGLGRPEHLTYHINQAVNIAKARRIGHGVDLPFEQHSDELLQVMKEKKIPVEINLTSNEFILGVKDTEHPITLYHKAGIPIIISTDDPGILRTSLTEQYTLAALRYGFSYNEIKEFVNNSITYSFLPDQEKGDNRAYEQMKKLKELFTEFEKKFLTEPTPVED